MTDGCPPLSLFEERLESSELERHIRGCRACGVLHGLVASRRDASSVRRECPRIEDLLASRAVAPLGTAAEQVVMRHLASCSECRAVAHATASLGDPQEDPA